MKRVENNYTLDPVNHWQSEVTHGIHRCNYLLVKIESWLSTPDFLLSRGRAVNHLPLPVVEFEAVPGDPLYKTAYLNLVRHFPLAYLSGLKRFTYQGKKGRTPVHRQVDLEWPVLVTRPLSLMGETFSLKTHNKGR